MIISLEGPEAAGKTSQVKYIEDYCIKLGHRVTCTREPGAGHIGVQIRKILMDSSNTDILPMTELMLYAADRHQHVETIIKPGLEDDGIVICDRYVHSTLAYQHYARGIDIDLVQPLLSMATGGLMPDVTFLLDLPVEEGLRRARGDVDTGRRDTSSTRFENEEVQFHEKVRAGYLSLAKVDPRIIKIDANRERHIVTADILEYLHRLLAM